jgi:hypothetical protein
VLLTGTAPRFLSAQDEYRTPDYVVRRIPCWTTNMVFYDPVGFPYYSVDGYFFDANPFQTTRFMDGNTSMIMRSSNGYSLMDVSGRYRWTDARIRVNCYARDYLYGLITQPYAVVVHEFGTVEPFSTACKSDPDERDAGQYITSIDSEEYNPYDPDQQILVDCEDGDFGGNPGSVGNMTCWQEHMVIEISYDGGVSWNEFWSGWATVCESNAS